MSYALKIPSVNFASVSVGSITYVEPVPCTGITLSENAVTFDTYRATKTITATLTPSDTTDTLTWASSDNRIATVNEGTITIHGIGTATITATCGNATATVTVTASSLKITDLVVSTTYYTEGRAGVGSPKITTMNNIKSVHMSYNSADSLCHYDNTTNAQLLPVPYGATTAKLITSDGSSVYGYIVLFDTEETVTYNDIEYASYISKTDKSYTNGFAVTYGTAFGTQAASATSLDMASYMLFT